MALIGEAAQQPGEQARVEMEGIGHRRDGGRGDRAAAVHPPRARRQFVERVAIEPGGNAHLPRAQPVMLERDQPHVASDIAERSEEHTSELQSLMRLSYAVFCLKTKKST